MVGRLTSRYMAWHTFRITTNLLSVILGGMKAEKIVHIEHTTICLGLKTDS